jgi:hypothetical protein
MGRKRVRKIHQYLHGRPLSAPLLRRALNTKNENQRRERRRQGKLKSALSFIFVSAIAAGHKFPWAISGTMCGRVHHYRHYLGAALPGGAERNAK